MWEWKDEFYRDVKVKKKKGGKMGIRYLHQKGMNYGQRQAMVSVAIGAALKRVVAEIGGQGWDRGGDGEDGRWGEEERCGASDRQVQGPCEGGGPTWALGMGMWAQSHVSIFINSPSLQFPFFLFFSFLLLLLFLLIS